MTWNTRVPNESILGNSFIQARLSKSGFAFIRTARTGSASHSRAGASAYSTSLQSLTPVVPLSQPVGPRGVEKVDTGHISAAVQVRIDVQTIPG